VIQRGRGKSSRIDMEAESFVLFTFRGGRIVRMEIVLEEEHAFAAAGLSE
jgi:hypothetical protein